MFVWLSYMQVNFGLQSYTLKRINVKNKGGITILREL